MHEKERVCVCVGKQTGEDFTNDKLYQLKIQRRKTRTKTNKDKKYREVCIQNWKRKNMETHIFFLFSFV